jgi:hypothetical protein
MIPDISTVAQFSNGRWKTYLLDPHTYTRIPPTLEFPTLSNLLGLITDHPATDDSRSQIRTQFGTIITPNQIPPGRIFLNSRIFLVFNSTVCKGRDEFELLFSGLGI